jgi:hypothetical protein
LSFDVELHPAPSIAERFTYPLGESILSPERREP